MPDFTADDYFRMRVWFTAALVSGWVDEADRALAAKIEKAQKEAR